MVERDWAQRATIEAALGRVVAQHVDVSVGHYQCWHHPGNGRARSALTIDPNGAISHFDVVAFQGQYSLDDLDVFMARRPERHDRSALRPRPGSQLGHQKEVTLE